MAGVELPLLSVGVLLVLGRAPAGVEAREGDRIAGVHRQDRLEVA
jgi:hypothetical protein